MYILPIEEENRVGLSNLVLSTNKNLQLGIAKVHWKQHNNLPFVCFPPKETSATASADQQIWP